MKLKVEEFTAAAESLTEKEILDAIKATLDRHAGTQLDSRLHGPWAISHGILGLGPNFKVNAQFQDKEALVTALAWMSQGASSHRQPAFVRIKEGYIRGNNYDPASDLPTEILEGHPNQFIGYLSDLKLPRNQPWLAWSPEAKAWQKGTLGEIIDDVKMQAGINPVPNTILEMSWTLWALANYLDPDETWKNEKGEDWSIEKIIKFEVDEEITENTACGGTHRLYAIFVALEAYYNKHHAIPENSTYSKAEEFLEKYISIAIEGQNPDGSLSGGGFFEMRMATDWGERITTNGHLIEFLARTMPIDLIKENWFLRATYTLAADLSRIGLTDKEIGLGPLFHGLHALRLVNERLISGK